MAEIAKTVFKTHCHSFSSFTRFPSCSPRPPSLASNFHPIILHHPNLIRTTDNSLRHNQDYRGTSRGQRGPCQGLARIGEHGQPHPPTWSHSKHTQRPPP